MARLKTFRNINHRGEIGHNRYRTGPNINGYIKVSSKTCLTDFEGLHFLWNFEWCQFVSVSGCVGNPVRQVIVLSAFVWHNRIRSTSLSRVWSYGTNMAGATSWLNKFSPQRERDVWSSWVVYLVPSILCYWTYHRAPDLNRHPASWMECSEAPHQKQYGHQAFFS